MRRRPRPPAPSRRKARGQRSPARELREVLKSQAEASDALNDAKVPFATEPAFVFKP